MHAMKKWKRQMEIIHFNGQTLILFVFVKLQSLQKGQHMLMQTTISAQDGLINSTVRIALVCSNKLEYC
jgi:hypothetical protein